MKSRLWLNLALLVVVILLAAVVIFKPGVDTENKSLPLTSLKPDNIQHIYIQRKNGKDIELIKDGLQWWMIKPVNMPADDFQVSSLLKLLETSRHSQHQLQQLEAKTYGLDSPRATITFNQDIKISFGASEPLHKRRYLSIENELFTTDDLFYYQLASDFSRYLDPVILPPKSKINRLVLPAIELKQESGSWHRLPEETQLSADADVELVEAWQHAAALKIELIDGFNNLKANVQVYLEGKDTPLSMLYHMQNDNHYLIRLDNGIRYSLPADIAARLALHHESSPYKSNPEESGSNSDATTDKPGK